MRMKLGGGGVQIHCGLPKHIFEFRINVRIECCAVFKTYLYTSINFKHINSYKE